MGQLSHFDITEIVQKHGLKIFVETGTGLGNSMAHALDAAPFDMLCSIEIHPKLYGLAAQRFYLNDQVYILPGHSVDVLPPLLDLLNQSDPVLFWLDAHFPGADYGLTDYGNTVNEEVRLPLWSELDVIRRRRLGASHDVILIDDARLFINGKFEEGNLPNEYLSTVPSEMRFKGFERLDRTWSRTHEVMIDWADQGYFILSPKGE